MCFVTRVKDAREGRAGEKQRSMYKVIGGDRHEYGPASVEELCQWIREGRLNGSSLAQAVGSTAWLPMSSFDDFAEALREQAAGHPEASGSSAPPVSSRHRDVESTYAAAATELRIGECLSRGWGLMLRNFGFFFAAAFLVWMVGFVCQWLPLVGIFYWLVRGVFYGGLYMVFLNRARGQSAAVSDAFSGFGAGFAQLMLAGVVTSLLSALGFVFCIAPGIYLAVAWIFTLPLVIDRRLEFWSAMELSRKTVTRVWFQMFVVVLVAFLPFIVTYLYAEVKISLAMYGVMRDLVGSGSAPDFARIMKELNEKAMELAKTSLPLILAIKIVLLLNMPFALSVVMCAYETLFGTRRAKDA
jgi:hypothetical protein